MTLTALAALTMIAAAPAPDWKTVETLRYGPPGASAKLTIEANASDDDSPRLKVVGPGGVTTIVTVPEGIEAVTDALQEDPALIKANRLSSHYFYASDAIRDAAGQRLLVVFGNAGDSDTGSIRIFRFGANGRVDTLMAEDAFNLIAVADLNHDGKNELVGRLSLSQMDAPCYATYDPLGVFKLAGDKFVYDEALSKTYNLTHGYVWAGPKSREDIAVYTCGKTRRLVAPPKPG